MSGVSGVNECVRVFVCLCSCGVCGGGGGGARDLENGVSIQARFCMHLIKKATKSCCERLKASET